MKLKKFLAFLLAISICMGLGLSAMADDEEPQSELLDTAPSDEDSEQNDSDEENFDDWFLYLLGSGTYEYGDVIDVALSVNPEMDRRMITWKFNSNYLRQYDDGIFEVIKADSANKSLTIVATYDVGSLHLTDSCTVTIRGGSGSSAFSVTLDDSSMSLRAGDTSYLIATGKGGSTPYSYSWTSEDTGIARVSVDKNDSSRATVSAVGAGTTRIRVQGKDANKKTDIAYCTIKVTGSAKTASYNTSASVAAGAQLSTSSIASSIANAYSNQIKQSLDYNLSITFDSVSGNCGTLIYQNGSAISRSVTFSSFNSGIYFQAKTAGTFTTRYTLNDNSGNTLSGTISISVAGYSAQVTNVNLSTSAVTMSTWASSNLGVTVTDSRADYTVSWNSSNTNIVTISGSGNNVTLHSQGNAGNAVVTVSVRDNNNGQTKTDVCVVTVSAQSSVSPQVQMTNQSLTVNGKAVAAEIYNINGNNYFKLRDVAMMLNGTGSQFSVGYNDAARSISVVIGQSYEPNGSELVKGTDKSSTCVASNMTIFINGVRVTPQTYNLGGNNFMQLRELGNLLGFNVGYDEATRTMLVSSR